MISPPLPTSDGSSPPAGGPLAILSLGNCSADHGALSHLLRSQFGAELVAAHTAEQAARAIGERSFALVLVNRVFDQDGDDGLEAIRRLKALAPGQPVMLLSNFADYQQRARQLGAEPGFGKAALQAPATRDLLAKYLSEPQ